MNEVLFKAFWVTLLLSKTISEIMLITKGIKNIIFDLGGVLVDLDGQRCIDAFNAIGAHIIGDYVYYHRTEDLFYDIEIGNCGQERFCDDVRRMTGIKASDREITDAWNALLTNISDDRKSRLLNLRKHYRLFLLSNTNDMHWNLCADKLFNYHSHSVSDYFERVYLSYRLHMVKPDPAIFQYVLDDAGLKAGDTLFIDDNTDNCHAAGLLGIHTLLQSETNNWMQML